MSRARTLPPSFERITERVCAELDELHSAQPELHRYSWDEWAVIVIRAVGSAAAAASQVVSARHAGELIPVDSPGEDGRPLREALTQALVEVAAVGVALAAELERRHDGGDVRALEGELLRRRVARVGARDARTVQPWHSAEGIVSLLATVGADIPALLAAMRHAQAGSERDRQQLAERLEPGDEPWTLPWLTALELAARGVGLASAINPDGLVRADARRQARRAD